MPGVPSSRSCDGCRRQKKKCDQAQPVCSRCARLEIPCVGNGQQRYKFQNQTICQQTTCVSSRPRQGTHRAALGSIVISSPSPPPRNAQTTFTDQLICALEVVDPRFDLSVYGDFVREIPRRVGSHAALDAAADSLAASLPLVAQTDKPTAPMLQKFGHALQALRVSLSSPAHLDSLHTLCALYLVVICHGWMRDKDQLPRHGEAVASILDATKGRLQPKTDFEQNILSTLCFLVILESFINPHIHIDPDLWNLPEPHGPQSLDNESLAIDSMSCRFLMHAVSLIRDPPIHTTALTDAYARVCMDRTKLAGHLATIPLVCTPDGDLHTPLPLVVRRIHLRWQTAYGLLTLVAMRLNGVLQTSMFTAYHGWNTTDLRGDIATFTDDIISLAAQAKQYRPLGSSAVPLFLLSAAAALGYGESARREQIRSLLAVYRPDLNLDQLLAKVAPPCERLPDSPDVLTDATMAEAQQGMRQSDLCCIL